MFILVVLVLLYKTEQVTPKCPTGYYQLSDGCSKCYYYCYTCNDGSTCQTCASSECTLCTTTCASSSSCLVTNCSNCAAGYYLHSNGTCYRCHYTGCACTFWRNCLECLPGKFGPLCQYSCPDGCKNHLCNKQDGHCVDGCITGKHGMRCLYTCSGSCLNNVCNQDSGECTSGCADGYYSNFGVCQECPYKDRCIKCESSTKCTECIPGKHGHTCQFNCQTGCKDSICDIDSGKCSRGSCEDGFYINSGNRKCYSCRNSRCSSCSNSYSCDTCASGQYWGSYCQYICENCASGCNKVNGCSASCQTGYYRLYDTNKRGFVCIRCPVRCLSCTSDTYCDSCKHGYYVYNNNCESCNSNCKVGNSPVCNSATGSCTYGCKQGFFGERCDTSCDVSNCQLCSAENSSVCYLCKDGFYLETVTTCSKCPANCKTNTKCNAYNGICTHGCSDSWSGQQCNQPCPKGCQSCDQFNSSSCSVCNIGFYGDVCEENCSSQCQYQANVQVCSDQCDRTVCNRSSGICTFGCSNGYTGPKCMQATVSANGGATNVEAIGAGVGAGVALLLAVIGIAVVFLWRRRHISSKPDATECGIAPKSPDSQSTEVTNTRDNQQEGGYQNLMLKTLDRPAGIANTRPPRTSLLDSTIEVYQELNPRIQPENPYSALALKSASHASIKSNVDINTEEYQNTAACTEAILPSNYQELNSDCKGDSEYNSVSNE